MIPAPYDFLVGPGEIIKTAVVRKASSPDTPFHSPHWRSSSDSAARECYLTETDEWYTLGKSDLLMPDLT